MRSMCMPERDLAIKGNKAVTHTAARETLKHEAE